MLEIKDVKNLIKEFTKKSPSDIGDHDPRYSEYLAKCSELYMLDKQLTFLSFKKEEEDYLEKLSAIETSVRNIINTKI